MRYAVLTALGVLSTAGAAQAACSGASCATSNNRQAISANQFTVSQKTKLITNDGASLLAKGGGKLLSPANTNPNGLMRGVGR